MNVAFLQSLAFPAGERCFIWGKCLEVRGLRMSWDFDILVTSQLFERLKNTFPSAFSLKENKTPFLLFADQKVEIFKDLPPFEGQEQEVIARAEYFDGVPYMAFDDLIAFKQYLGRPKDFTDIELLQKSKC